MKRKLALFALLVSSILSSCKKDDEVPPIKPEVIKLTLTDPLKNNKSYTAADTISNELDLKVDFTEQEKNASQVEVYVDEVLLSMDDSAPFEFKWNTLKLEDGKHSVKTVVTEKSGNKVETKNEYFVENTLLKLKVYNKYLYEGEVATLIISDNSGRVLYSGNLINNTEKNIKIKDSYPNEVINVTLARRNSHYNLRTYINIKKGASWILGKPETTPSLVKVITVRYKGDYTGESINFSTNQNLRVINLNNEIEGSTIMEYLPGSKLYVEYTKEEGRFYDFIEIKGTSEIFVDLNTINKPLIERSITDNPVTDGYEFILGQYKTTTDTDRYFINALSSKNNPTTVVYPGSIFSSYEGYISYTRNGTHYYNFFEGEMPESVVEMATDLSIVNNKINKFSCTASGEFDSYSVSFRQVIGTRYYWWDIFAPVNQTSFVMPNLESVISEPVALEKFELIAIGMRECPQLEEDKSYFKRYSDFPSDFKITNEYEKSKILINLNQRNLSDGGEYFERVKQEFLQRVNRK